MTKDLTQGKITPLLVKFTIPLLFGNIFQLMYNSVDSIIVGQLVGKEALAAVGTSNPLMTLAILFVNGMCIGASILMGTQYGAKKMDVLKRQISTTMIAGIVFSIAVTLFCILFARPLLLLIRVQEEVLPPDRYYYCFWDLFLHLSIIFLHAHCGRWETARHRSIFLWQARCSISSGICFSWQCSDGAAWAVRSQRSSARRCVVCFASFTLRERCRS